MLKVNKLKFFIRQKQAAHKRETGKNLPQVAIAVELGIDPATLSQYANNRIGSVNWEIWEKLAEYFDVEGHEIFDVVREKE